MSGYDHTARSTQREIDWGIANQQLQEPRANLHIKNTRSKNQFSYEDEERAQRLLTRVAPFWAV
jgi:hypothetical protein